jgi:N-acetylneuraminic acid mutarotase
VIKPNTWKDCAKPPGGPRQENAVVLVDGKAWVLGGFQGLAESNTSEIFDPTTGKWSDGPKLPEKMHHLNVAAIGKKVYILGFLKSFSFTADGRSWVWDGKAWKSIAPMPRERIRGASGVGVIDGKIYVAGGLRKGKAVLDFSVYDPATDKWTTLPNLPGPIDHLAFGVIGSTLYLAGGRQAKIASHQNSLYAFDAKVGKWATKAPMPTSRGGVASAVHKGRLYVFGGEGNKSDPKGVFGQVEVYDPATNQWTNLPPMPTPRHGTAATSIGDGIFVPVGADKQAFGAIDLCRIYYP